MLQEGVQVRVLRNITHIPSFGIIKGNNGTMYAIEFPTPFQGMHDCEGRVKSGQGYWINVKDVSAVLSSITLDPENEPAPAPKGPETYEMRLKRFANPIWDRIYKTLAAPEIRNILLYGPPGTGKTSALHDMAKKLVGEDNTFMTTSHDESIAEELTGHWVPKGSEFIWHHGFASRAFQTGVLIINEIDLASGSYKTCLHSVLDDADVARLRLPNGEVVRPHAGFKAVATMNGNPEDLAEALRDRFDVKIFVGQPSPGAMAALDDDLVEMIYKSYSNPESITVSYRAARAFMDLRKVLTHEEAAEFAFGTNHKDILTAIKMSKPA
jgi:hypothetical protein